MEQDFIQLIKNNISSTYQNNIFTSNDNCNCLNKLQLMTNCLSSSDEYFRFKKSISYYNQNFKNEKKISCNHKWNIIDATKLIEDIYLNWSDEDDNHK
jgi:hypothetical protein